MGETKRYAIPHFDGVYEARQVTEPRDFEAAAFARGVVKAGTGGTGYIEIEVPMKDADGGEEVYNHSLIANLGDWIVRDLEDGEIDVYPEGMFDETFAELGDEDLNPIDPVPEPEDQPEYMIYPDLSVDAQGLIRVTPELLVGLVPLLQAKGLEEGDAFLRVAYVDLKTVIQQAGGLVKEVRHGVDL